MDLPPCIKKAVVARDKDALDEVFSYLKSFADEKTRDAVLWSIGYYDLSNYQQRKLTAEAQIKSAPFFVCTPLEKPEHLSKYCTPEDEKTCPLRDPVRKFRALVEEVTLEYFPVRSAANLTIRLRDGTAFVRRNAVYHPVNDTAFWDYSLDRFLDWYSDTHGRKFPDFVVPKKAELKGIIFEKLSMVVRNEVAAVHQADVE